MGPVNCAPVHTVRFRWNNIGDIAANMREQSQMGDRVAVETNPEQNKVEK